MNKTAHTVWVCLNFVLLGATMRVKVLVFAASFILISSFSAGNPQSPTTQTSSPQAATLLTQSTKALIGAITVNDVTLTGTVEWIAGSDDETGSATYKGLNASYRLDMSFRNGTRSEIVSTAGGGPAGSWIGPDGVSHSIANHNLMTDAGWFPAFTLASLLSAANSTLTYIGQETRNGGTVIHITAAQQFPYLSGDAATRMQHLTQVEIYLDSSTLLPVSYVYNSHPNDNLLLDIPTEIDYSNYQNFGGALIPLHVQKSVNNSLLFDLQFQNASVNTGLSPTQITTQ